MTADDAENEEVSVGIDVGATLAKVVRRRAGDAGPGRFDLLRAADLELIARHVASLAPARVGITGGGATALSALLDADAVHVGEFDAWAVGARRLIARQRDGPGIDEDEPFLLVSLGTGTSVLHVTGSGAVRVGGTALGGGTVVGLGAALTGRAFHDLCELAERGNAAAVDLRVSDVYGSGEIALAGDLTAANFGKFAHRASEPGASDPLPETATADLAAGVMQLVGENVALICAGLAAATKSRKIVFGGATVRSNPRLTAVLRDVTTLCALEPHFLHHGEFAGAVGALHLATSR